MLKNSSQQHICKFIKHHSNKYSGYLDYLNSTSPGVEGDVHVKVTLDFNSSLVCVTYSIMNDSMSFLPQIVCHDTTYELCFSTY